VAGKAILRFQHFGTAAVNDMKSESYHSDNSTLSRVQTVTQESFPTRRSDLSARRAEGEILILDRVGGVIHQLNPTASKIWELCDGKTSVKEIVAQIVEVFAVDARTASHDIDQSIANFRSLNLLESDSN
jgi:hypothetical protein